MKAYKCDRCGAFTTHSMYEITFKQFVFKPNYELCEDCFDEFKAWFYKKEEGVVTDDKVHRNFQVEKNA